MASTSPPSRTTSSSCPVRRSSRSAVRAINDDIDDDGEYVTFGFGTLPDDLVYVRGQETVSRQPRGRRRSPGGRLLRTGQLRGDQRHPRRQGRICQAERQGQAVGRAGTVHRRGNRRRVHPGRRRHPLRILGIHTPGTARRGALLRRRHRVHPADLHQRLEMGSTPTRPTGSGSTACPTGCLVGSPATATITINADP